jgi:NAD(P)-dependent dehydrogenase (short-subunit alcohol dehydrogenase family)
VSLVAWIKGRSGASGFGYASTAEEVTEGLDLTGKTVLITGVSSGLGLESARVLAKRGAHVIGAARSLEKAREACAKLGEATPVACELSEPASVFACAAAVRKLDRELDVIMCNAGIMALPKRETAHGIELQFFTNHIGHFILVTELIDRLSEKGRVVVLSSGAHTQAPAAGIELDDLAAERSYAPWTAYGQSKLANLLFARILARRFEGSPRTANAVHPGVIHTNLGRHNAWMSVMAPVARAIALKDVHQGAATQCFVAVHPSLEGVSGEYFADCNVARSTRRGRDLELGEALWAKSEDIVSRLRG